MIDQDEKELVQKQIQEILNIAKEHKANIDHAVESLQQASKGQVSIIHFKDVKRALDSMTETRKGLENAKRLVKGWVIAELKED